ncbi:MAG TPA: glycosyltransferase family 39 protein [Roseiflexaceae bacterium]|nr:glycosyltransferase family 39 protein [Roseiflexaceae bacterium]
MSDLLVDLPRLDPHPPLHYLMLQAMIGLGGDEWQLRLPSALAGIVCIGLVYALGAELFDRQTGRLSALVLSLSPLHIWYAQEARMYALVAMLTLAAGLFAARALRSNRAPDWAGLGVCQGLALLSDTGAIWFTIALAALIVLIARPLWHSGRLWPWVAAQLLAMAIFAPWIPAFRLQLAGGYAGWIPPATPTTLVRTIADFLNSYERSSVEALLTLLLLLAGSLVGGLGIAREAQTRPMSYALLVCWVGVPVGLAFMISQPYIRIPLISLLFEPGQSIFLTRNLIVATFPLFLLFTRSLVLARRAARVGILAGLVAFNIVSYAGNHTQQRKADYRAAAEIVRNQAQAQDLIVLAPAYLERPFAYYYETGDRALTLAQLDDGVIGSRATAQVITLAAALNEPARIWLISSSSIYHQDTIGIAKAVQERGWLHERWEVQELTVALYDMQRKRIR